MRRVDHSLSVAEELLSALLDISRLDQGALQPKWTRLPVAQLLDKIERQFSALAERRGLRLRVRPCDRSVRTDPKLLQRILFNLVNNAVRYTRVGSVLVGCRVRDRRLRIEVWDTGPGITAEEQERIFEEFERLGGDASDEEFDQGLGLGLSICRRISQMLDARLELRSRPGRGSVFRFSAPLLESDTEAVAPPSPEPGRAGAELAGLSVLCIDDDPEILDGMRLLLERWGCRVQTARNGIEAEQAELPELVLADYHLADGENGLDVCRALVARAGHELPVILLTADRSEALGEQLERHGYLRLVKPVKPAALRALIRHRMG